LKIRQQAYNATKQKCNQDEEKRDQEHQDLYWFTLPQGLRPVLCQKVKNFSKLSTTSMQYVNYTSSK